MWICAEYKLSRVRIWPPPAYKENSSGITRVACLPDSFIWDTSKFLLVIFLNLKILKWETVMHLRLRRLVALCRTQRNWESQKERATLGEKIHTFLRHALFLLSFNRFSSIPIQRAHAGNGNFRTEKACLRTGTLFSARSRIWGRTTRSQSASLGTVCWSESLWVFSTSRHQTRPFCLLFQRYLESAAFQQRHWRPFFKTC